MRTIDIVRRRRARARQANARGPRLARALVVAALLAALAAVFAPVAALAGGAAGLLAFVRDLPDIETLRDLPAAYAPSVATTRLYAYDAPAADGLRPPVLIDEITDPRLGGAGWLAYDDLPPAVISATLAAADPAYFDRPPLDLPAAAAEWARTGVVTQAQSPLLAELVAAHLRPEDPPLQDWFLGWQIERRFGREQVLEWTLNTTYYGHLAYGIEAAARLYFGVGATELTPAEAALLAAVGRDPTANPFDDPAAARAGAAGVLATMVARDWANAADSSADALARLTPPPGSDAVAPAFARLARAELERLLGPARLVRGGFQVETTLDLPLQAAAACVAAAAAGRGEPVGGGPPCPAAGALADDASTKGAAVVILDVPTGAILALAGDAPLAARPVGTLARPFIALSALSQGYTAASLTYDVEQIYLQDGQPYVPPDDGDALGPLRLRAALAAGRAAPATQMLGWVGVARVLENTAALGVLASDATPGLAFAQEGFSADLLSLTHAFAALGNGGTLAGAPGAARPRPATVVRVLDGQGEEVYALAPETRDVVSPELAWLLTDMLRTDAGGAALATGRSAAGGDWTVGLSPARLVGVWAGGAAGDDNAAVPVWRTLFDQALGGQPAGEWPRPAGLHAVDVCALSGLPPSRGGPDCPTVIEWFVAGTEPTATDTMLREVAVNRETGRLATIFTPPNLVERRVFTVFPPEAAQWAADHGIPAPPTEYDPIRRVPTRSGGAAVASPEPWAVVGRQESPQGVGRQESPQGQWSVVGSAGGDDFAYYRLSWFSGLMPEAMHLIVARGETAVADGELGVWDTTLLDDGLYTLLLTVVRADGTFDEVAIPVRVANGDG